MRDPNDLIRAGVFAVAALLLGALCSFGLTGCNEAQIRQAEVIVQQADDGIEKARSVLALAQQMADQLKDAQTTEAVAKAAEAVRAAEAAAEIARSALVAAKKSQENGDGTMSVVGTGLMTLLAGLLGGKGLGNRAVGAAVQLAAIMKDKADAMRLSETEPEAAEVDKRAAAELAEFDRLHPGFRARHKIT